MHLYKNCRDLSIYNFDMIYRTNDLRYLIVGYNGYDDDVDIPQGAEKRWEDIKKEWVNAIGDNTLAYKQQLMLEVNYLQVRYNLVGEVLELLEKTFLSKDTLDAYIQVLRAWNYIYNKKISVTKNIEALKNQHNFSLNRLKDKLSELDKLIDDSDNEESSLEKQAVILAKSLEKDRIDIRVTSVLEWIELLNLVKVINAQHKKNGK